MDAWLHTAMGNDELAMAALRDWRANGGCRDLSRSTQAAGSLSEDAEFRGLVAELRVELMEQRAKAVTTRPNANRVIGIGV